MSYQQQIFKKVIEIEKKTFSMKTNNFMKTYLVNKVKISIEDQTI